MIPVAKSICIANSVTLAELASLNDLLLIRGSTHESRSEETAVPIFSQATVWHLRHEQSTEERMTFDSEAGPLEFSMRSTSSRQSFVDATRGRAVVIDITGLSHSHWAWLLQAGFASNELRSLSALYVEPESYTFSESPVGGEFFDLSERIMGIAPMPGFATIRPRVGDFVFVALLGFEGPRLTHMIEEVQPNQVLTYPIIGVPGFQIEFPFFAIQGNRRTLQKEEGIWANHRFVRANCPNSLYSVLSEIRAEHPSKVIKIAPIGTKPHALGAVLFKLNNPASVDLIYDHPVRKPGRTSGASSALLYRLDLFRGGF